MQALAVPMADDQQKPRLSPDWDPAGSSLTPSEGFLLSRIDGHTPWEQLRHIGGLPPAEVDRCLERWLSEGILVVNGSDAEAAGGADPGASATDLSPAERRRIEEFEGLLSRSYHEVLGVDRDADTKAIKRAYFALSKEFHPDRHFRRELGGYRKRLEQIFMKIVEAYELLSDPATRAEIERNSIQEAPAPPPKPEAADDAPAAPPLPVDSKRATLERMRRHFRIPEKVLAERQFKAKQFQQSAMVASKKGNWLEAAASIRLAIAFDPWNDDHKRDFARVQAEVHQMRAAELLEQADASLAAKAQSEAMRMYEEALGYRPCDPEINRKAALLAIEIGDLDAAREYAETACEANPDSAADHCTRGKVLQRMGLLDRAREAFERALEIDPDDAEAKSQVASLKQGKQKRRHRGGNG
jgi:tetratricopeptide (TPR) repeat protein